MARRDEAVRNALCGAQLIHRMIARGLPRGPIQPIREGAIIVREDVRHVERRRFQQVGDKGPR